jgi:serine/threonine protein kinase
MKEALDKATIMLTLILTVGFVLLCVLGVGTFPAAHTYFVVSQMNHPLLTHDPTKPLKLSKLKLREVLGRGTFGIVHRASYYGLCVAVKQLTPINDEDGMVEREIDLHRRLQCPTLLRMYGVCKDRFNVYLVLEYALYGSLRKVCRGTGINAHNCINAEGVDVSLEQRMQWLTDIMAAVSYLHKHNVLHRDIKCDNVVLRADMRALLGDLGLSINLTSRRSHASSQGVGTCVFRAPEVSEPGGYKASADVYSFGITVMELLLSSIPGSREHGLDDMQSLSETCPELEFQLQKLRFIAERCTSHTPGDRPCATQVLQWLDNVTYLCWSNPRIDDHDW